ncbi:MAG: aldehyde dehydrogenase [Gammaproteobacteria bacterium RIFCSPHIGHO2_12_FULL_37_34]|nr:MAG: aldehyde dehydrogenase [Gammaproteobacteria bacterium RIFCSPHIGHO2_12_FULL_37_34]
MHEKLLSQLHIGSHHSGVSTGLHWWSSNKKSGEIHSYNPTNGELIASIYRATKEDYEHTMKEAERSFLIWRDIPAPKRGEVIRAIGDELRKQKDFLGSLVSLEMGKSKQEGDGEVQEMIDMADFAVGQSRMLYGKTMHSERTAHRMYEQWHPLGVVLVISAFNFPVAVWSWNAFIAAICGNAVIWKPSPKTSLCAIAVQHICNRICDAFGYRSIFSLVITDDSEIIKQMVSDQRFPLVSFTGSTIVGREINTIVGNRLGKALLELSGNNAIIIDESADLQLVMPAVVFGAIGTAGQRCTTTRRLIIHESIYETLVKALVAAYQKITVGDPLDQKNIMGPLIDQHAVDQFIKVVQAAKQKGGNILFGGKVIKRKGFFVEPTIIEAENHWEVVQQETFAPILYVMKYKLFEEAIAMQNHSSFGLSSALFTTRLQQAEAFLSAEGSDCGIANINMGTSGAEIGGAFGGEKATGGGREAGSDVWKAYMRRQTNTINWGKTLLLAQGIRFQV